MTATDRGVAPFEQQCEELAAVPPPLRGIARQLLDAVRSGDARLLRAVAPVLAKARRRKPGKLRARRAWLDALEALRAGRSLPPAALLPAAFDEHAARRSLASTRGVAAAAALLTGDSIALFKDAQRTRRRQSRTV